MAQCMQVTFLNPQPMRRHAHLALLTLFIISISALPSRAQLHCRTTTDAAGTTEICKHANGKKASARFWDVDKRSGFFEAFDATGNSIAKFDLRRFAGHASVDVSYFANGQVARLEYSSAPDGGIQFWHIIMHFDEAGQLISKQDLSQPDGHPVLYLPEEFQVPQPMPYVVPTPPSPEAPKKWIQIVHITNATGKQIKMGITDTTSAEANPTFRLLVPNETWTLDTLHNELHEPGLDQRFLELSPRDERKYEFVLLHHTGHDWYWVITHKPRKIKKKR
jgi:hypothetical protein